MHTCLEVAVARKHGCRDDVLSLDHILDAFVKWTRVTNAGGAAVANGLEAQEIEFGLQASFVQIVSNHARTRAKRCFDRWLDFEAERIGFFRKQACGQHHAGVRSIGAACNRSDQHRTVSDCICDATFGIDNHRCRLGLGFRITIGSGSGKNFRPLRLQTIDIDAILRTFRTSHAGLDAGNIHFHHL